MNSAAHAAQKLFRNLSLRILPWALVLVSIGVVISQFMEVAGNGEVLSLTSFIVLMSFSGIGFGWARVVGISEESAKRVCRAAVDLFTASLLALVSAFFSWIKALQIPAATALSVPLFALHWLFLVLSVALSLAALISLLHAARDTEN